MDIVSTNTAEALSNVQCFALPPEHFPLVKRFYKHAHYSPKVNKTDEIYVLKNTSTHNILAALRLVKLDQSLILRSMVVSPENRRLGYGQFLLEYTVSKLGNRECWCYPFKHLETFYEQAGFCSVTPEDAPHFISEKFRQYIRHGKQLLIMKYPR